jgi:hypothetical protein
MKALGLLLGLASTLMSAGQSDAQPREMAQECGIAIEAALSTVSDVTVIGEVAQGDAFTGTVSMTFTLGGPQRSGLCEWEKGEIKSVIVDGTSVWPQ